MTERSKLRTPPSLIAGLNMFGILVLIAIIAPIFLGHAATTEGANILQPPTPQHWLGTDGLGRDILARTLVATRLTLVMASIATIISVVVGVLVGGLIWVGSRRVKEVVLRIIDSTVAFPALVLALIVAAVLGPATSSAVIALSIAGIPSFARITSNLTASVAHRDYVGTARLLGVRGVRIFSRHLLPNIAGPLLVLVASSFALTLLDISSLSFIGLGVQSPEFDWGRLLTDGLPSIYSQPLQVVSPSVMLVFTGVAAMLTGDGLAIRMDPRSGRHGLRGRPVRVPQEASINASALVEVRNLTVTTGAGVALVKGISFDIEPGEILGLVGESGSGKSMTAMSLAGLQADGVVMSAGLMRLDDLDLSSRRHQDRLARDLGLVYQDPGGTFNPALRMGAQLTEVARVHMGVSRRAARDLLVQSLRGMRIRGPEELMTQHPFQLSGGMLQRAMIASSLVTKPRLIIADEPTTALDVTVQAEVLRQLKRINRELGTAMLFISHDIGVVEALCDRVLVMQNGEIVERITGAELRLRDIHHPYTKALLDATPILTDLPEPVTTSTEELKNA